MIQNPSPYRRLLLACLVLVLSQNNFSRAETNSQANKPVVKIGAILPLTGDMALHGVEIQRSMNLALEETSRNSRYSYELLFEDNQLDGKKSVAAAHRLIDLERVNAVVTLWPPTAEVVIPISERTGTLHYTISWDPDLAAKHKLVLSHQAMVSEIARRTIQLLKSERKKNLAFFHMEEAGFNLGARYIREIASELDVSLVADEAFDPHETDFRSLISKTAKKTPDAYLVWAVMPSMDLVLRQIKSLQPNAFVTGYFDYAEDGAPIEGMPYVSEMFASSDFISKYRTKFRSVPASKGANAYDIVKILVAAFENSPAEKPRAAELKKYLVSIRDYPGAVGKFSVDAFGNSTYSPVVRRIEKAGRSLIAN